MSIYPQPREVRDIPKPKRRQTQERKGLVKIEKKPQRARDLIPWALNQDDPFRFCLRGVKEPNYKLQPGTMGRHGQATLSPKLQYVNEAYLHQRDVQLVKRVHHTTTNQNPKGVRMYEYRRCPGKMKELLHQRWNGEAKPSSKLLSCKIEALSPSLKVEVVVLSDVSRLISARI